MRTAEKKKAKKNSRAPANPAGMKELADKDLEQVQGGWSRGEQPFILPQK